MADLISDTSDRPTDLMLSFRLATTPEAVWRCWTEPDLIKRWFAPEPWTVPNAEVDLRPGGHFLVEMAGPDGTRFGNPGVFLEAVPNERLVFTDAYAAGWVPNAEPFMTAVLTVTDDGAGGVTYTALARHWTQDAADRHREMGFHPGWSTCIAQLETVAQSL